MPSGWRRLVACKTRLEIDLQHRVRSLKFYARAPYQQSSSAIDSVGLSVRLVDSAKLSGLNRA